MSVRMKYIVLTDGITEYPVIFDAKLAHINVAEGIIGESAHSRWSKMLGYLSAVAAGFVQMPECHVDPNTGSESLKLEPRPQDEAILRGDKLPPTPVQAVRVSAAPRKSMLERARSARSRPTP